MIDCNLIEKKTGVSLHTLVGMGGYPVLIAEPHMHLDGSFATKTIQSATITVVAPPDGWSLQLTDLIWSADKLNNGAATLTFTDGVYSYTIAKANMDFGFVSAIGFSGHWQGWVDAYVTITSSGAADVTAAVGYVKIPPDRSLKYAAWNALR